MKYYHSLFLFHPKIGWNLLNTGCHLEERHLKAWGWLQQLPVLSEASQLCLNSRFVMNQTPVKMPWAKHLLPVIFRVCAWLYVCMCLSKIIFIQVETVSGFNIADFYLGNKWVMLIQIFWELNELSCIISGPLLLNNRNSVLEIRPF